MLENPEEIGIEVQNPFSNSFEGNYVEAVDYIFAKMGLDFTKIPIPRIMGLMRQMRVESEELERRNPNLKGV